MNRLICIGLLLYSGTIQGQNLHGSRTNGLNGSNTALPDPTWSLFANPAGLSYSQETRVGWFSMRHFGLREITDYTVVVNTTVSGIPLAAGASGWGFDLYRELRFRGGSGWYNRDLRAGFALEYRTLLIQGYGHKAAWMADAGLLATLSPEWEVGFLVENLTGNWPGGDRSFLPGGISIGAARALSETVVLSGSAWKDRSYPVDIRVGLSIRVLPELELMAGCGTDPAFLSYGIHLAIGSVSAGLASRDHPVLGWSHGLDITLGL